jgi:nicotinamidase-related amidase
VPLTQIDPTAALVVVDLQAGVVGLPMAHPTPDVVARSAQLAGAFRDRGRTVVLVNVEGTPPGRTEVALGAAEPPPGWSDRVPELGSAPDDVLVTKHGWSAFSGTGLDEVLRARGVTQVVIAGIATTLGVESTARAAHELGYHVTLVVDAMTDLTAEAHDHALGRIFPGLAETGTTQDVLALLTA